MFPFPKMFSITTEVKMKFKIAQNFFANHFHSNIWKNHKLYSNYVILKQTKV